MFEPDEYVKPTHSTGFIIEGLNTIAKSTAVTESAIKFDQTTANHIECSLANKKLCNQLNNQFKTQSRIVDKLKNDYIPAQNAYNECNNKKNTCEGIEITIKNTQKQINDDDAKIKAKSSILDTCNADKAICDKLNQQIADKKNQINVLKNNIATNEAQYKNDKCIA